MIKRKLLLGYAIFIVLINHVDVHASSYADEWLAKKQAQQQEYMKSLEQNGNLTDEAYKSITKKDAKKKDKKNNKNNNVTYGENRGYIYGVDELHVTGLPTNPNTGYTLQGDYGIIE